MNGKLGTQVAGRKRRGVLTFEWILLISLLTIGIIGGIAAVRNALLAELNDVEQAINAIDIFGCGGLECGPGDCSPYPECCDKPWWCWNRASCGGSGCAGGGCP